MHKLYVIDIHVYIQMCVYGGHYSRQYFAILIRSIYTEIYVTSSSIKSTNMS